MKINLKSFFAGILVSTMLFSSTLVFAETSETIQAIFGRVKLMVNGTPVAEETLLYNGTTYVPLRAAADILGMEIDWNEATSTASLNNSSKNTSTPVPTPTPAPVAPIEPPVTSPPASSEGTGIKTDSTTSFYKSHPTVPDYGKTYNVKLEASYIEETEKFDIYFYGYTDLQYIENYCKLLIDNGFSEVERSILAKEVPTFLEANGRLFVKGHIVVSLHSDSNEPFLSIGISDDSY